MLPVNAGQVEHQFETRFDVLHLENRKSNRPDDGLAHLASKFGRRFVDQASPGDNDGSDASSSSLDVLVQDRSHIARPLVMAEVEVGWILEHLCRHLRFVESTARRSLTGWP